MYTMEGRHHEAIRREVGKKGAGVGLERYVILLKSQDRP